MHLKSIRIFMTLFNICLKNKVGELEVTLQNDDEGFLAVFSNGKVNYKSDPNSTDEDGLEKEFYTGRGIMVSFMGGEFFYAGYLRLYNLGRAKQSELKVYDFDTQDAFEDACLDMLSRLIGDFRKMFPRDYPTKVSSVIESNRIISRVNAIKVLAFKVSNVLNKELLESSEDKSLIEISELLKEINKIARSFRNDK